MDWEQINNLKKVAEKATQEFVQEGLLIYGPKHKASNHHNGRIFICQVSEGSNRRDPALDGGEGFGGSGKDDAAYIAAANPQAILELIEAYERLETITNGYKVANDEAQEIIAELRIKIARLEEEADWLATAQNWNVSDDEPTRCPESKEPPDGCIGINDCTKCWRTVAREAVAERAEQSDIEPR